jgi:hypothetical protein
MVDSNFLLFVTLMFTQNNLLSVDLIIYIKGTSQHSEEQKLPGML